MKRTDSPSMFSRPVAGCSTESRRSGPSSTSSKETSPLFPQKSCLFCNKECKWRNKVNEGLTKCVTTDGEENIKRCAREKKDQDILGKIEGIDLIAREAVYHESCRRDFVRPTRQRVEVAMRVEDREGLGESREKKAAYDAAFHYIVTYVQENVIKMGVVLRMTMLGEKFLEFLNEHYLLYLNADYQTHTLKERPNVFFGDKIQVWRPNSRSDLIYSSGLNTGEAVEAAFEAAASESRILDDVAAMLRRRIRDANLIASDMPWPPSATILQMNPRLHRIV